MPGHRTAADNMQRNLAFAGFAISRMPWPRSDWLGDCVLLSTKRNGAASARIEELRDTRTRFEVQGTRDRWAQAEPRRGEEMPQQSELGANGVGQELTESKRQAHLELISEAGVESVP